MAVRQIRDEKLIAIAEAIRGKTGKAAGLTLEQMPTEIDGISGGSGGPLKPAAESMAMAGTSHLKTPVSVEVNLAVGIAVGSTALNYEVLTVDGATYGFALNDNGYYESQNKGVDSSFAICKIAFNLTTAATVKLKCINYAETTYDYGLISEMDTMLSLNNTADTTGVLKSFYNLQSANVVTVSVSVPAGEHFICIKYIKDSSQSKNNDSLQFIVSF